MQQRRSIFAALILFTMAGLAACEHTRQAYQNAETLDAKAYVMGEHFNALQNSAVELIEEGSVPQAAINRIAAAEREARPVILGLTRAGEAYKAVRSAETEAELQLALNDAALALSDFIKAMRSNDGP